MWRWVGSSSEPRRGGGEARRARLLVLAVLAGPAALWPATATGTAQTLLTQEEALELAFPPPASVERRTAFLDEEQLARARELAGEAEVESGIVTYYAGRSGERTLGYAYFDAHRVRTLPEVLMIVVTPEGAVDRVEVLRFDEPRDYVAARRWLDQFDDRELDERLSVGRGIVNLTGATLTARAVTRAVRRVLALHLAIHGAGRTP